MQIQPFHDPGTATLTCAVFDPDTRDAVVVDPILDYDASASRASTTSLDRLAAFLDVAKQLNPQLRTGTTKDQFVALRAARDRALPPPRLLYPSVQINIDAGRLPPVRANGQRYLTIPIAVSSREPSR